MARSLTFPPATIAADPVPWFDDNPSAAEGPADLALQAPSAWQQVTITSNAPNGGTYTFLAKVSGSIGFHVDKPAALNKPNLTARYTSRKQPKVRIRFYLPTLVAGTFQNVSYMGLTEYQAMAHDIIGGALAALKNSAETTVKATVTFQIAHPGVNMYNVMTLLCEDAGIVVPPDEDAGTVGYADWECCQYDPQSQEVGASTGAQPTGKPQTAPTPAPETNAGNLAP